jgi:HAD superfamily hydrolase (TIGR01490 family)
MKNSPSPKSRKVAVFDIDGTIFRSSLVIEVFNALVDAEVFPQSARHVVERSFVQWLDRKGHYNDYLMKLVRTYYKHLPNARAVLVDAVIERVIDRHKDRVYRFTRDLVRRLRSQGYLLIAISNSAHAMVERFADTQGFDAAIGRKLEINNGLYTGRILYNNSLFPINAHLDKVEILTQYLDEHGITADLSQSYAVGDSEGDIPLLSAVGKPIAFNPSLPLAKLAQKKGWQMVVERKDVIYHIHDTSFIPHEERQRVHVPYGKQKRS